MAALTYQGSTGQALYAVLYDLNGQVWNTSGTPAYEAFNASHWTSYAVTLTEQTGTGFYSAVCPSGAIATLGSYSVRIQAGGSPATSDVVVGAGSLAPVVSASGQVTTDVSSTVSSRLDAAISSRLAATADPTTALVTIVAQTAGTRIPGTLTPGSVDDLAVRAAAVRSPFTISGTTETASVPSGHTVQLTVDNAAAPTTGAVVVT